jgi:hypothetical protein
MLIVGSIGFFSGKKMENKQLKNISRKKKVINMRKRIRNTTNNTKRYLY